MIKEATSYFQKKETPSETMVRVEHLYKAFGTNKVLVDFNFILNKGENVAVLGKSGSGKSVFIKCLIGLLRPDAGEIYVFDKKITYLNHEELDIMRVKFTNCGARH